MGSDLMEYLDLEDMEIQLFADLSNDTEFTQSFSDIAAIANPNSSRLNRPVPACRLGAISANRFSYGHD